MACTAVAAARMSVSSPAEGATELPLELLPHILHALQWRTRDLAACCAVSRTWQRYATPLLYSRLFLRNQQRLMRVFATLDGNAGLAALVRVLEIRVFPFALQAEALEALEASMLRTLQSAVNLEALHWTRTGSLTDRVIPFLPVLSKLRTLELTGSSRFYSPGNVARYMLSEEQTPRLRHFSVVLPDRDVASALPTWAEAMGAKLQSFSVLCQHSALVSDGTLTEMAKHLTGLTRLSVAGCKVVTADGIVPLLRSGHIRDLAIEGLALHPASFSMLSPYLSQLRCLSLTFPRQNLCPVADFWQYLATFVEALPGLVEFTHYTSSWNTPKGTYSETLDSDEDGEANGTADDAQPRRPSSSSATSPQEFRRAELEEHAQSGRPIVREPKLSTAFLRRLVAARGAQLMKLRIHGIVATTEQVDELARGCPNLQDLVVHLYEGDKVGDPSAYMRAATLTDAFVCTPGRLTARAGQTHQPTLASHHLVAVQRRIPIGGHFASHCRTLFWRAATDWLSQSRVARREGIGGRGDANGAASAARQSRPGGAGQYPLDRPATLGAASLGHERRHVSRGASGRARL